MQDNAKTSIVDAYMEYLYTDYCRKVGFPSMRNVSKVSRSIGSDTGTIQEESNSGSVAQNRGPQDEAESVR